MSYTKYFPRDTKVMAQEYNNYEERSSKARQILDFEPLIQVITDEDASMTMPELLAEAVAAELNTAYDKGFYDSKHQPKDID
jgi:hypothetical protein